MADNRKITDQNVFFLSGFQSTLNEKVAAGEIKTGAFYLTEDTNRLYIGKDSNKLDLLNSTNTSAVCIGLHRTDAGALPPAHQSLHQAHLQQRSQILLRQYHRLCSILSSQACSASGTV